MAKAKRFPVMVDENIYNAFKQYSDKSGATVSYLIREALTKWAGTVLVARTESSRQGDSKGRLYSGEGGCGGRGEVERQRFTFGAVHREARRKSWKSKGHWKSFS